jgi:hypothetical protein
VYAGFEARSCNQWHRLLLSAHAHFIEPVRFCCVSVDNPPASLEMGTRHRRRGKDICVLGTPSPIAIVPRRVGAKVLN